MTQTEIDIEASANMEISEENRTAHSENWTIWMDI